MRPTLKQGDLEKVDRLQAKVSSKGDQGKSCLVLLNTDLFQNDLYGARYNDLPSPFSKPASARHAERHPISSSPAGAWRQESSRPRHDGHGGSASDTPARQRTQFSTGARSTRPASALGGPTPTSHFAVDIQRKVRGEEVASASGSGFGPGSNQSSASTKVDEENRGPFGSAKVLKEKDLNRFLLPSGQGMGEPCMSKSDGLHFADITGATELLGSPIKQRLGVQHVAVSDDVNTQAGKAYQAKLTQVEQRLLSIEQAFQDSREEFSTRIARLEQEKARPSSRMEEPRSDPLETAEQQDSRVPQSRDRRAHFHDDGSVVEDRYFPQRASAGAEPTAAMQSCEESAAASHSGARTESEAFRKEDLAERLNVRIRQLEVELKRHQQDRQHLDARYGSVPGPHSDIIHSMQQQILHLRHDVASLTQTIGDMQEQQTGVPRRAGRRHALPRDYGSEGDQMEDARSNRGRPQESFYMPSTSPIKPTKKSSSRTGTKPRAPQLNHGGYDDLTDEMDDASLRPIPNSNHRERRPLDESLDQADETAQPGDATEAGVGDADATSMEARAAAFARLVMDNVQSMQSHDFTTASAAADAKSTSQSAHAGKCTNCSSARKKEKKREAKREKLREAERQRAAADREEAALMEYIDASYVGQGEGADVARGHRSIRLDTKQAGMLQRRVDEMVDDYWHENELFSQLSEEFKALDKIDNQRKVLHDHLEETLQRLGVQAERITFFNGLLGSNAVVPSLEARRKDHQQAKSAATARSERESGNHDHSQRPSARVPTTSTPLPSSAPKATSSSAVPKSMPADAKRHVTLASIMLNTPHTM